LASVTLKDCPHLVAESAPTRPVREAHEGVALAVVEREAAVAPGATHPQTPPAVFFALLILSCVATTVGFALSAWTIALAATH
jgi:hypothetical protein